MVATQVRRARFDAYPEEMLLTGKYKDSGCDLHDSCLSCPFDRCRYEQPLRSQNALQRNQEALALLGQYTIDQLCARYGIKRRALFRALAQARGN